VSQEPRGLLRCWRAAYDPRSRSRAGDEEIAMHLPRTLNPLLAILMIDTILGNDGSAWLRPR
jgi:hypothetical protein